MKIVLLLQIKIKLFLIVVTKSIFNRYYTSAAGLSESGVRTLVGTIKTEGSLSELLISTAPIKKPRSARSSAAHTCHARWQIVKAGFYRRGCYIRRGGLNYSLILPIFI